MKQHIALLATALLGIATPLATHADEQPRAPFTFAPVVERVTPSVVSVYTSKTIKPRVRQIPPEWRRFFGDAFPNGKIPNETMQGLGSGVIVSEDGYILTNNHVVDGADEILVKTKNNQEYKAKKIGADPGLDIAVLKIDAKGLPVIAFGDSAKVRVGDIALAVGSPYGLTETVTMGIVSGMGRGMGIVDYEDFIQTDASINPGNSGGALVDAEGRLIGINTAIFSENGGNVGIGFAIPVNLARSTMQSLRDNGRVVRGFLGVRFQPMTRELANAFKAKDANGALVADVTPGSPAEKAGIKSGDIIIEIDGKKIEESRALRVQIASSAPGTKVRLKISRGSEEKTVEVTLAELPKNLAQNSRSPRSESRGDDTEKKHQPNVLDGITVGDLDDQSRKTLEIPDDVRGALITDIETDSVGYAAGLRQGDVIVEVNHRIVKDAGEAVTEGDKIGKKDRALLRVWSKGGSRYVALEPK
jgi:serine protease Do